MQKTKQEKRTRAEWEALESEDKKLLTKAQYGRAKIKAGAKRLVVKGLTAIEKHGPHAVKVARKYAKRINDNTQYSSSQWGGMFNKEEGKE